MEILRGTVSTVSFTVPTEASTVSNVRLFFGGVWTDLTSPTNVGRVYTTTLPYLQYDGKIAVEWNITVPGSVPANFAEVVYYDVVTPLLSQEEVVSILDDADYDYQSSDWLRFERSVRRIIQANTGQPFGRSIKSRTVVGNDNGVIRLPERLIRLDEINGVIVAPGSYFQITGDGWYLRSYWHWGIPDIREDYDGINEATVQSTVPIRQPPFYWLNLPIEITGVWGWAGVPEAVQEAARILLSDIATDSIYRDRYLTSMTAADWRIQFNSGAFADTGNVRADQLLADYVVPIGWAVI